MGSKIGRNQPCHCGSNKKYKYCHWASDRQAPKAPSGKGYQMNSKGIKMFNKLMQISANADAPLHEFCIDNDIYYFKAHSLAQNNEIMKRYYDTDNLTKEYLLECWSEFNGQEYYERMLKNDENCDGLLWNRSSDVSDLINAHFNGLYSLSIPSAFSIIEGLFREYGQVSFDKNQKPNYRMNEGELAEKMLYGEVDSIRYFTKFLNKIMSGNPDENEFHRNTVMHGVNRSFATKENSLLLLMTIFEFSRINNLDKLWPPKYSTVNGESYINGIKVEMRTEW